MLYTTLFLVRYFPFWAIPAALVMFELGMYHYNRRQRVTFTVAFGISISLALGSIIWIVFEGYWRAGPFVRRIFES